MKNMKTFLAAIFLGVTLWTSVTGQLRRQPLTTPWGLQFSGASYDSLAGHAESRLATPQLKIKVEQNKDVLYYWFMIMNSSEFDAGRFAARRRLPPSPCNPQGAARLLISYYTESGTLLSCRPLTSPQNLSKTTLRFLRKDAPASVYITLTDEQTRESVRSNLVLVDR